MSEFTNFSLEGKVALVTGASYGIGFAIASAYAECGATICFNDIKQELVDKGMAAYAEKGIKAHGYVCDVTNEEAVNAMVAQIEKEVGTIDILVNNAGIIKRIPMTEMTADQFRQVIDVDLNAPFIVSKAVIPAMIKKGHGKIINICSMMSELPKGYVKLEIEDGHVQSEFVPCACRTLHEVETDLTDCQTEQEMFAAAEQALANIPEATW